MTQTYDFGADTHLGGGDTRAFVVPSAAIIAQAIFSTFDFHRQYSSCCPSLMLIHAETHHAGKVKCCNNFLSSHWPPLLTRSTEHGPYDFDEH